MYLAYPNVLAPNWSQDESSPPPPKRGRYDKNSDSETDNEEVDLPYSEQEEQTRDIPESVDKFLKTSFGKSLRRETRKAMFHEFPKPNCSAVKVPPANPVLVDFMGSDFPRKRDEQLAKIQSAVTAATSPVCNLWADVLEQGLEDQSTDLIPAEVVLKTCKATVSLLGNAVSYINSQRRENIIKSLPKSRSKLASILQ